RGRSQASQEAETAVRKWRLGDSFWRTAMRILPDGRFCDRIYARLAVYGYSHCVLHADLGILILFEEKAPARCALPRGPLYNPRPRRRRRYGSFSFSLALGIQYVSLLELSPG